MEKLKEELKAVLDETSKQINGAATKDEIEALNKSLVTQLDKVSKQANSAATKDEIEALNEGLTTQLGEISKQTSSAATKEELKKLSDGIKKLGEELGSAAKDEVEKLGKELSGFKTKCDEIPNLGKRLDSAETEIEELKNVANGFETKISEQFYSVENKLARLDQTIGIVSDLKTENEPEVRLLMEFYERDALRENITFDDIILPEDIKQKLKEICESQKEPNSSEKKMKGYILHGPPGTGKTMIAKAIASETRFQSAFISVPASNLFSRSNIDKLFNKATENAPCVIFIDEIDSIGRSRNSVNTRYLNHLLTKLDGYSIMKGVTVIAATNLIENLDSSLIRNGRLSEHIEIPQLDKKTRGSLIRERLKGRLGPSQIDKVAKDTEGFSAANLLGLIEEIERTGYREKTSNSKINEVCEKYRKTHKIGKSLGEKHDDGRKVDNKAHQLYENEGFCAKSQPRLMSTPAIRKVQGEVRFPGHSSKILSPIQCYNETGITSGSNLNKSFQNISKLPSPQESIEENKENSLQQNQKSPDSTMNSTSKSHLKDAANIKTSTYVNKGTARALFI